MTLFELITRWITSDAPVAHDIVHGSASTVVETEGGPVRSLAKLVADNQAAIDAAVAVGDASLIAFTQSGTDAVLRNMSDKNRETLSVADMGADATGVLDATTKIQKAADAAAGRILRATGTFKISGALNLRNVQLDFSAATLVLDSGAPAVLIGGNAASTVNPRQRLKRAYRSGGATATPTLRVCGTKNQFIDVEVCDYLQLYADNATAPTTDGSIAYCTFNLGKIDKLEITNNPANVGAGTGVGGSIQWINENTFSLQRCVEYIVSGTYQHNHNRVFGGTFEGTSSINFLAGWDNYIYDTRFEGTPTVSFAAGTERNVVLNTWDSSTSNFSNTATVTDSGFDNVCMDDFLLYRHEQTLAYTDLADVVLDTQVAPVATPRARDLQRIYTTSITQKIVNARVAVDAGDYFRWVAIGSTGSNADANARYRPRIEFFNAKLQPVTASADFILTTGGVLSSVSGNSISAGTNVSGAVAAILPAAITAGVRFVSVSWIGNSPSTASISTATQLYVSQLVKKSDTFRGAPRSLNTVTGAGILVSGIPTQGFAPAGQTAIKSDASAKYVNKFEFETVSTVAAVASDAVIQLTSKTGVLVGDIVGVNLDDLSTHWTTVSSISTAGQISITAGVPSGAAIGSRIVFNRWSTY